MFKKLVLLACFFALLVPKADASHLMGGEITWACQGGGQYIFTLKLYRDCNGAAVPPLVNMDVANLPGTTSITLNLVSQNDISPVCNAAGPSITCADAMAMPGWPSSSTPVTGAVQETTYQSGLVTLSGVPPPAGWVFTYTGCCRNGSISNLQSPSAQGYTMRAVMYNYNGQNASPCFDSSPKFLELPSTVICLGTSFSYNHNAYDPELDSLNYSWAEPLDDYSVSYNPPTEPLPLLFTSGYSYSSPLPGTLQNPSNIPATINPVTGEITFTSYTQGSFVTVVKVEAWKCGQLVAEIYREMQIVLLPCASNTSPAVTYTSYQDTVVAGTVVNFTLNASDPDLLADGVTPQNLSISASGNQFGAGFTNAAAGCSNPPCATLSPAPPASAPANTSTTFNWQTSCSHISTGAGCSSNANTYTFVFKVKDDFCPAPAEKISTVSITVLAPPLVASPQPRCVAVQPNGDVVLTWTPPADTGGTFNSYQIYTAPAAGGPYTLLDSIFTIGQDTYTHVGANAQLSSVYYYIATRSGCLGQVLAPAADTVHSMLLNVINPANGTAVLTWNSIASPLPASSSGVYTIYEEYPAGVWSVTGTTTSLSYIDTIYICNGYINYRVEMSDTAGCTSVSSFDGSTFLNTIVPSSPLIDTLSVDDSNHALLNWNMNPAADVEAYVVYIFNSGLWIPVDTLYGLSSTNYTYLLSAAGNASEQYRLTAYDSCGNVSPLGIIFKTIYLSATADVCARSAVLSWNAYPAIGTGLAGYRIYQSNTGAAGPYTLVGTVAPGVLTYTVGPLPPNLTYHFKVEAFDASGKTASSNRYSFYSAAPVPPLFTYLRKVSVADPDRVIVTCHVDTAASSRAYKIMRSYDTVSANFSHVGTVAVTGSTPVVFTDANVHTDKYSYYYKMINVDSCGFDGIQTNIGRTILLKAISHSDFTNSLVWNDYENWQGSVMSYNIYRGVDGVMDPVPIANVPFMGTDSNTYTDDISMLMQGQGVFNYYVEALEGMGNSYGFSDNSLSNIAEAYQDPQVFIPNAFKPSGVNNIFIPVTSFVNISDYEFYVFNRWGLKVFSTTDVNEGWDGTHGGTKSELGVYVYLVRFKTLRGEFIERKGSVTLIR
ncbi:MAG: hypothetical protein JWO09_1033 [Bacteroidetes bacterium]|nr:hypothetical protein [Bacteroidota bacterium]